MCIKQEIKKWGDESQYFSWRVYLICRHIMVTPNLILNSEIIDESALITDIVTLDYRTADVFTRHGIDYCCGGKMSLSMACQIRNLNVEEIKKELNNSIRNIQISPNLPFDQWDIDFLSDYITHVHHTYIRRTLPVLKNYIEKFVLAHRKKMSWLDELQKVYEQLSRHLMPHLQQEEEIIFPYVKQIAHAYNGQEPYAKLLVRTLRKPVEDVMNHEHNTLGKLLNRLRELTHYYHIDSDACTSHKVVFHKLRELDNDLVQHIHLENNVLFPRAIAMETELLQKQD
jgi:regulator of cell morphogenesis and NO signaling